MKTQFYGIILTLLCINTLLLGQTDSSDIARQYNFIGQDFFLKSNYDSSNIYHRKASEIYKRLAIRNNDKVAWGRYFTSMTAIVWNYAEIFESEKAISMAHKYLTKAKPIIGEQNIQFAFLYNALGFAHIQNFEYDSAFKYYTKSTELKVKIRGKISNQAAMGYSNVAVALGYLGKYDLAIEEYKKCLDIYFQLDNVDQLSSGIANAYHNIGFNYDSKKQYHIALEYYLKGIEYRKKAFEEENIEIADSYSHIGRARVAIGQYRLAMQDFNKSLKIREKVLGNAHLRTGLAFEDISIAYQAMGLYDSSLYFCNKYAEILHKQLKANDPLLYSLYDNMALSYNLKKDYDSAVEYFSKSLLIKKATFDSKHPLISENYYNQGLIYFQKEDYLTALKYAQKAIYSNVVEFNDSLDFYKNPKLDNYLQSQTLLSSLHLKAISSFHNNDTTLAIETFLLCDKLLDQIKSKQNLVDDRISFEVKANDVYQNAISVFLQQAISQKQNNYFDIALLFSEKNKAALLLDAITKLESQHTLGIPQELLLQENDLKNRIALYQQRLVSDVDDSKKVIFRNKLFNINREYEKFLKSLEKNYPKYHDLKYSNKVADLITIQSNLSDDQTILSYAFGTKNSFVFIIQNNDVKVIELASLDKIEHALNNYYNKLQNENRLQDFAKASTKVYSLLIQPLESYLQGKKKLIVTSPLLLSIPFESLIRSIPTQEIIDNDKFGKLNYLVNDFEFSYHYSATLWLNSQESSTNNELNLLGFAPYSEGESGMFTTRSNAFRSLPESGKELKAIYQLFAQKQELITAYLSNSASKTNFLEQAPNYNIIHIASHSNADMHEDKLAKIHFAECVGLEKHSTSCLFASSIYNLNLNADLVVLSSCESGAGKLVKGEGVMSLARAFLYAGAKNVISSLWEADDTYTKELMLSFYTQKLKEKASNSTALRLAKLKMIQSDEYLHPKFWSEFILIGE